MLILTSLLFLVCLLGSCTPQDTQDLILSTLETLAQKQDILLQKIDESQKTLEERIGLQVEEIRTEIDAFKTMFLTEQGDMMTSIQQCSTKDQMTTFQNLIAEDCQTEVNKTRKVLLDAINTGMDSLTSATQEMPSEFLEQKESQGQRKTSGSNCKELLDKGEISSGVYTITPEGFPDGVEVYCDQETDGGGWSVIFQRKNQTQQLSFVRTFEEYAAGFGDPNGEIWIGNRVLHSMTGDQPFTLRVDAKNLQGESRTGIWQTFSVGSQDTQFTLSVAGYSSSRSTLGDGLSEVISEWANGMKFSTYDRDNDETRTDCSGSFGKGGWWYKSCFDANPTAPFGDTNGNGVIANWMYWKRGSSRAYVAISEIQFKIRP